jgi:hypothetical protein
MCLSRDHLELEVVGGKAVIADALGAEVASFAYPYSRYDYQCREVDFLYWQEVWLDRVEPAWFTKICAATMVEGSSYNNRLPDLIIAQELVTHIPIRRVEEWGRSHGMEVTLREDICRLWYGHELLVMKRTEEGCHL